jgi:hypothetical protein
LKNRPNKQRNKTNGKPKKPCLFVNLHCRFLICNSRGAAYLICRRSPRLNYQVVGYSRDGVRGGSVVAGARRPGLFGPGKPGCGPKESAARPPVAQARVRNAVPKIARISDKDGRMVWGEAVGLFGLACFWALTLFMVFREPAA